MLETLGSLVSSALWLVIALALFLLASVVFSIVPALVVGLVGRNRWLWLLSAATSCGLAYRATHPPGVKLSDLDTAILLTMTTWISWWLTRKVRLLYDEITESRRQRQEKEA